MIDDSFRTDSIFPPLVSMNSNNFMLSRDNSFFDTKFTSNEFRLQFNKNFDIYHIDNTHVLYSN